MHEVKMKWVVIRGKADGLAGGPPTIKPLKEFQKKKLKNVGDHTTRVPLSMYDLTRKRKEYVNNALKYNNVLVLK